MTLVEFLTEKLESGNKYRFVITAKNSDKYYNVIIEDKDYKYISIIPDEVAETDINDLLIVSYDEQ